jgi:hypothetical protein
VNHRGSCHCGRVTFEVQAKLDYVVECNCSYPFVRPRLDPTRWAVNVLCIDGVDAKSLPVRHFDGENWEAAAKAFQRPPRG